MAKGKDLSTEQALLPALPPALATSMCWTPSIDDEGTSTGSIGRETIPGVASFEGEVKIKIKGMKEKVYSYNFH